MYDDSNGMVLLQDETPLFIAAREGSYEVCKTLLDNFANREITDHMDRLPRDIASERRHSDIVRLLDEHVPHSPQMMGTMSHNNSSTLIGKLICFLAYIYLPVVSNSPILIILSSVCRLPASSDEPLDAAGLDQAEQQEQEKTEIERRWKQPL